MSSYPCIVCGYGTRVIDSRPTEGDRIRRRRKCCACKTRFTTFEVLAKDLNHEELRKAVALCSEVTSAVERYRNGGADHG